MCGRGELNTVNVRKAKYVFKCYCLKGPRLKFSNQMKQHCRGLRLRPY